MKLFKKFMHEAIELAVNLYTIVGGMVLLFLLYGLLWLIVSMIWKKVHIQSYLYVVNTVLAMLGKKPIEETVEEVVIKKEEVKSQ